MLPIAPDVNAGPAGTRTYTMTYLNGAHTYTEPFAVIHIDANLVSEAEGAIEGAIGSAVKALKATPYGDVAAALADGLDAAGYWINKLGLNPDGSLSILIAYHYAGPAAMGVDLTASPLPGVPAGVWDAGVNALLHLATPPLRMEIRENPAGEAKQGNRVERESAASEPA